MVRDGRGLLRGRRVRRTRTKIRQQAAPVGIVYPTSSTVLYGNLKSGDVPNLLPALLVLEECNVIRAPSVGDTVESMGRPFSPCASAVIDV
jgi:hypothetical protein